MHRAGLVPERAGDAIDQRRFARAVRADQPQTLAGRDREVDGFERDETAEAFAQFLDAEQGLHQPCLRRLPRANQPMMPLGAITTNPTRMTPTNSRLSADEMVTVAICCTVARNTAPSTAPIQLAVPPTSGMAMLLTASDRLKAEEGSR